jgi:hypothetical protein
MFYSPSTGLFSPSLTTKLSQKTIIDLLDSKTVANKGSFVGKIDKRSCSLVFSTKLVQAVRNGDVRDLMPAKDSDTLLLTMNICRLTLKTLTVTRILNCWMAKFHGRMWKKKKQKQQANTPSERTCRMSRRYLTI